MLSMERARFANDVGSSIPGGERSERPFGGASRNVSTRAGPCRMELSAPIVRTRHNVGGAKPKERPRKEEEDLNVLFSFFNLTQYLSKSIMSVLDAHYHTESYFKPMYNKFYQAG